MQPQFGYPKGFPMPPTFAERGFRLFAEGGGVIAPGTGQFDQALTTFAKKFPNNQRIADLIAPAVMVERQKDKYYIHSRANQQLLQKQLRATGAPAERIRMSLSDTNFNCESHALAALLADELRQPYADAGDLEQDATQTMIDLIMLGREDNLATMLTDTAQVTNNTTLAGADQWSDDASTPGPTVQTGMDIIVKAGVRPNFMAVGWEVFAKLRWHPAIKKAIVASTGRNVQLALSEADLAAYFGVENFWVGAAVKLDKEDAVSFIWGKHAILGYVSPTPSLMDVSGAKTFRWRQAPGTSGGIGVVKARSSDPTAKSDIVGVDDYYDQKITAVETLYLIKNAVA